jgi:hypothetical protein
MQPEERQRHSENPFQDLRTLSVLVDGDDSHLGFVSSKCSHRLRAYLSEVQPRTPATGIRNGRRQLVGAYVVSIQGRSIFTVEQANLALTAVSTLVQLVIPSNSFSLRCCRLPSTTSASSAVSTQMDPRSSHRLEGRGFCVCVYYRRCA